MHAFHTMSRLSVVCARATTSSVFFICDWFCVCVCVFSSASPRAQTLVAVILTARQGLCKRLPTQTSAVCLELLVFLSCGMRTNACSWMQFDKASYRRTHLPDPPPLSRTRAARSRAYPRVAPHPLEPWEIDAATRQPAAAAATTQPATPFSLHLGM